MDAAHTAGRILFLTSYFLLLTSDFLLLTSHFSLLTSCNLKAVIGQNSTIRSLFLEGPTGRLEALLNAGAENATHAAVVCHPHPLFGGTLHNKVVFHTMKALNGFGFPLLRFNFGGAGQGQGPPHRPTGEAEDLGPPLDWLDPEFHLPLLF